MRRRKKREQFRVERTVRGKEVIYWETSKGVLDGKSVNLYYEMQNLSYDIKGKEKLMLNQ